MSQFESLDLERISKVLVTEKGDFLVIEGGGWTVLEFMN